MDSVVYAALAFRSVIFDWSRAYIVGVVNVTPDSFSDGNRFFDTEAAIAHGARLAAVGADMIDIGGESTRPASAQRPVSAADECARVLPVIRGLRRRTDVPIAVDTTKAEVAAAALDAGAEVINDISGGLFDPQIIAVTAAAGAAYVCGHVRGRDLGEVHTAAPADYEAVLDELRARLAALPATLRERTMIDPGLGFGKGTADNVALIARAGRLGAALARPVMIGASRKRFLGELTGEPVLERDAATVGASLAAVGSGASLLRVHDVALLKSALIAYEAIRGA